MTVTAPTTTEPTPLRVPSAEGLGRSYDWYLGQQVGADVGVDAIRVEA